MALIDEGKVIEAFHQIKAILFTLDDIPKAVDRLRLRFAGTSENGYSFEAIPYHPNIYVCVHELFYIAFKSNLVQNDRVQYILAIFLVIRRGDSEPDESISRIDVGDCSFLY